MNRERLKIALYNVILYAKERDLQLSIFLENLVDGFCLSYNEDFVHSSASTIKIPLMISVLEEAGKNYSLQDRIDLTSENKVEFSVVTEIGEKSFTIEEYLSWMMIESCNTSTNQMIDLVGYEKVNRMVQTLGLEETVLQRKMMDVEARKAGRDNLTSARDMARLLRSLYGGEYLGREKSDYALELMKRCRDYKLLLRYLPNPPSFAHKSGGLDDVSHDVGIFFGKQPLLLCGLITNKGDGEQNEKRTSTLARLGRWIVEEIQ